MRFSFSILVASILVVAPGCSQDQDLSSTGLDAGAGGARIQVSPERIDVGPCPSGEIREAPVTITNTGSDTLFLEYLELTQAGSFGIREGALFVPPGAQREIWVEFAPLGFEATEGRLTVHSSDPTAPEVVVELDVLIEKELPVQIDWVGRLPDHFILTATDIEPETVTVIGGQRILEKISALYTEKVPLDNLEVKGTITANLALTPAALTVAPDSKDKVTITYLTNLRNQ